MAVNKRKILEGARKLVQKGAREKALKEYQKLVRLDPKDAKLRLEIGDAYRRWGQVEEAIDTYSRVAQQYMSDGFDARAVAVFKQILNLDPDRFEYYEPLAEIYERMGLTAEAIQSLQTAADGYHRAGKKREALELLRKMASVDASNTTSRIKVADLLRQEGMKEEAVVEYGHAAAELERQGDVEALGNVYRRMLELDESNVEALASLARNLLARGKAAEAAPLAERALQLDEANPERYESLATVYEQASRQGDVSDVYRRLAGVYRERGDDDKAREILQRHVPAADLSVSGGGAVADELSGEPFLGGDELETDESLFGEDFPDTEGSESALGLDAEPSADVLGADVGAGAPPAPLVSEPAIDEEPLLEEPASAGPSPTELDVEQLIAEASVYLRYGKREKAVAHLEAVLAAEPEHRGALEKLGEAFADGGEPKRAVEVWLRAAKRAKEDEDEDAVGVLRGRIAALDEAAAEALDPPPPPPPPSEPLPSDADDATPSAEPSDEREIELDLSEVEEEFLADDDLLAVSDEEAEGAAEAESEDAAPSEPNLQSGSLSSATTQQILDDLEEADFYMQQGLLDEAEAIYQRVLSVAPNHPRALVRLGEIAAARGAAPDASGPEPGAPDVSGDFEEISVDLPGDEPVATDAPISASEDLEALSDLDLDDEGPAGEKGETEDDSDTAEFTPSLSGSGGDPIGATATGAIHAADASGDEGFDLAAALSDAFDDDPDASTSSGLRSGEDDSFSAVFQAFKKGVSETLSEADHQAHYDLAIAYKEMGLLDDALAELRLAMGDPARKVECLHLMGVCAIDAGQEPAAVEHLEALLAVEGLSPEQGLAGRFDLGRAYQALGDVERARQAYEAVAAVRPDFQDLQARLASLDRPGPEGPEEPDEDFESFDDIVATIDDDGEVSDDGDPAGETFDDLVSEANAADEEDADGEPEGPGGSGAPPAREESGPAAPRPQPAPSRPKKKKKISFL